MNLEEEKKVVIDNFNVSTHYAVAFMGIAFSGLLDKEVNIEPSTEEQDTHVLHHCNKIVEHLHQSHLQTLSYDQSQVMTYTYLRLTTQALIGIYQDSYKTALEEQEKNGYIEDGIAIGESINQLYEQNSAAIENDVSQIALSEGLTPQQVNASIKILKAYNPETT